VRRTFDAPSDAKTPASRLISSKVRSEARGSQVYSVSGMQ
jgi:hypothetical protein